MQEHNNRTFQSKACAMEQRARCKRPIANQTRLATLDTEAVALANHANIRQVRDAPNPSTGSHCRIFLIASAIAT
jgi:hypothetical protein